MTETSDVLIRSGVIGRRIVGIHEHPIYLRMRRLQPPEETGARWWVDTVCDGVPSEQGWGFITRKEADAHFWACVGAVDRHDGQKFGVLEDGDKPFIADNP